jgi:hypothetical protein
MNILHNKIAPNKKFNPNMMKESIIFKDDCVSYKKGGSYCNEEELIKANVVKEKFKYWFSENWFGNFIVPENIKYIHKCPKTIYGNFDASKANLINYNSGPSKVNGYCYLKVVPNRVCVCPVQCKELILDITTTDKDSILLVLPDRGFELTVLGELDISEKELIEIAKEKQYLTGCYRGLRNPEQMYARSVHSPFRVSELLRVSEQSPISNTFVIRNKRYAMMDIQEEEKHFRTNTGNMEKEVSYTILIYGHGVDYCKSKPIKSMEDLESELILLRSIQSAKRGIDPEMLIKHYEYLPE